MWFWIHGERDREQESESINCQILYTIVDVCIFSCYYYCPWVLVWLWLSLSLMLLFFFINGIVCRLVFFLLVFFSADFFSSVCLFLDCFRVFMSCDRIKILKSTHCDTEKTRTVRLLFSRRQRMVFFLFVSRWFEYIYIHERYLINTLIVSSFTIFCACFVLNLFGMCIMNQYHLSIGQNTYSSVNLWFFIFKGLWVRVGLEICVFYWTRLKTPLWHNPHLAYI